MIDSATAAAALCETDQALLSTGSSPGTLGCYDRTTVAGLSDWAIDAMSALELARVIRDCRFRELRPEVNRQLDSFDRSLLEKLLYILRRNFREQLAWAV